MFAYPGAFLGVASCPNEPRQVEIYIELNQGMPELRDGPVR
jgi:hypothetical protein